MIVVPGATGHVIIQLVIAVDGNVQPGALFVAERHSKGILEFFPEPHIHQASVQRTPRY